ncbi:MAG: transcriptional repressor [Oscillibacter sp.]|jgi:Fe2+ or Zn2+ uptake regulation protein|nr:transcriptional repressor [Oscillibacter sp.]
MTKYRALIDEIVNGQKGHVTIQEIYFRARERCPAIVLATVYNNVNALVDSGRIRRIRAQGRPDHYERLSRPHDHLICDRCGALSDILIGSIREELARKTGIPLTGYELNLHYVCPACAGGDPDKKPDRDPGEARPAAADFPEKKKRGE